MSDIYTIERKVKWSEIANRIYLYLSNNLFDIGGDRVYFLDYINSKIKYWKDNNGALSLTQYFDDIGVDYRKMETYYLDDDFQSMLFIQAMLAQIFWISEIIRSNHTTSNFNTNVLPLLKSTEILLSGNNYAYTYDIKSGRVLLHKRDIDVDSAIESIDIQSIKIDILSYIDFRTSKDLLAKQSIIARLYKYIENPQNKSLSDSRVQIKSASKEINTVDIFMSICNNFDVRHYPKEVEKKTGSVITNPKELHELCDIAFYMFIEAIRIPKIVEYESKYTAYINKYLPKK